MRNYINHHLEQEMLKTKEGCIRLILNNAFGIAFSILFASLVFFFVLLPAYDVVFIVFGILAFGVALYLITRSILTLVKAIKALKSFKGNEEDLSHASARDFYNKVKNTATCPKCGYQVTKDEASCPICGSKLK